MNGTRSAEFPGWRLIGWPVSIANRDGEVLTAQNTPALEPSNRFMSSCYSRVTAHPLISMVKYGAVLLQLVDDFRVFHNPAIGQTKHLFSQVSGLLNPRGPTLH